MKAKPRGLEVEREVERRMEVGLRAEKWDWSDSGVAVYCVRWRLVGFGLKEGGKGAYGKIADEADVAVF